MKYAVIYNPMARNSKKLGIGRIAEIIRKNGADPLIYETTKRGDGIVFAQKAVREGAARIYPAGGDGILNEALSGLMKLIEEEPGGKYPVVCPIPLGTVNVFSKEMGFSADPENALRSSFQASESAVDIGQCNTRYFILMASAGFDGFVISELEKMIENKSRVKSLGGSFAYVVVGLKTLFKYGFPKLLVTACSVFGKKRFYGDFVLVSNSRFYGGKFEPNPAVKINDGFLDLLIFNSKTRFENIKFFYDIAFGKTSFEGLDVKRVRIKSCEIDYIEREKKITYSQIDGELYDQPPLSIRIHAGAIKILKCN